MTTLTIAAKKNVTLLNTEIAKNLADNKPNNAKYKQKFLDTVSIEVQNKIAQFEVNLVNVHRNKLGKLTTMAEYLVNNKMGSRKNNSWSDNQQAYLYDCILNVCTKSKYNTGEEITITAGDIGARMGELDKEAPTSTYKGMEGDTQPYAVLAVFEFFDTDIVRTKATKNTWFNSSITIKKSSKFGKAFFKLLDSIEESGKKHVFGNAIAANTAYNKHSDMQVISK